MDKQIAEERLKHMCGVAEYMYANAEQYNFMPEEEDVRILVTDQEQTVKLTAFVKRRSSGYETEMLQNIKKENRYGQVE